MINIKIFIIYIVKVNTLKIQNMFKHWGKTLKSLFIERFNNTIIKKLLNLLFKDQHT